MNSLLSLLRRLWAHDKTIDSLKVALALAGVLVLSLYLDQAPWMISLILGVIASALAETEDRVSGRLKALCAMLLCFAVAAFSVKLLFAYPLLFVVGLTLSSFGFVMLGAAGERYATIAVASLILAVYTMLGADQHQSSEPIWLQPMLLLAGAAWYGLLSVLAAAVFSTRATRQSLARVFNALSAYLALKADLLEPIQGRDEKQQQLGLAEQNGRLVGELNHARNILIRWVQDKRIAAHGAPYLKWYFLAQDVHERASSSHYPYQALTETFARSDILFRARRLMQLQAQACARLAEAILRDEPFAYGREGMVALDELAAALQYVQSQPNADWVKLSDSLADLCRNITTIERLLAHAGNPHALKTDADSSLQDSTPQTLREALRRIRMDLTPASSRFRHGVRLGLALAAGYGLLHALDLPQGYWVLLTTVFVCQPNYSGTWRRMGQRIGGTVLGLFAAWLFITAFPQPLAQLTLAVAAGVAFFALRADRYTLATACITVLVLACFNQLGSGYALIWPRLLDTVLGALIAGAAVAFILPDWQGRRLHVIMARTVSSAEVYLAEILAQYQKGKRDDLAYRVARRNAHNAVVELSSALSSMLGEPDRHRLAPELAFRFLYVSHSLLSYVSALGAHREQARNWQHTSLIQRTSELLKHGLQAMACQLNTREPGTALLNVQVQEPALGAELGEVPSDSSPSERRVIRQLALIYRLMPEMDTLVSEFLREEAART